VLRTHFVNAGTTLKPKRAILVALSIGLVNQIYGYTLRQYPWSADSLLWGFMLGLQIKNGVYRILKVDSSIPISISQLARKEPGYPPIETVITVMSTPVKQYKIHKAVNQIDEIDICDLS
jgi:hypothetical protein